MIWIVQGCLKWQRDGLTVPQVVEDSTEEYRASQNPLREFFEDCCEFDPCGFVPVSELRAAYDKYADENGAKYTLGPREFNKRLREKGCEQKVRAYSNDFGTEKKGRCWQSVTLKDNTRYETDEEIPI